MQSGQLDLNALVFFLSLRHDFFRLCSSALWLSTFDHCFILTSNPMLRLDSTVALSASFPSLPKSRGCSSSTHLSALLRFQKHTVHVEVSTKFLSSGFQFLTFSILLFAMNQCRRNSAQPCTLSLDSAMCCFLG